MCAACTSVLPGPESSPPAQTGPHHPPDPGSLHKEKPSGAHATASVSRLTVEAGRGSFQLLRNKRGRHASLFTGGWSCVSSGDTSRVRFLSCWTAQRSHRRDAAPVGTLHLVAGAGGRVQPPRRADHPASGVALLLCWEPDHTWPVCRASVCSVSAASLACAVLGFVPGEVHGGPTG